MQGLSSSQEANKTFWQETAKDGRSSDQDLICLCAKGKVIEMAGVPDFIMLDFTSNNDADVPRLTIAEARENLIGKVVGVRISKSHYRYHDFVIQDIWQHSENKLIHSITLERKDLKEKREEQIQAKQDHEAENRGRE